MQKLMEKFGEVETTKEYDGYYYEVAEVISIVVLGSLARAEKYETGASMGGE